ncbi:22338_t:CDS:2 [Cetraspora pellucida]|uniref:22338_t:CDS:1 n=1 Tax=Cetraspora pellucida TaxID=1433469 RepID=A0A9N9NIE2_9GLOM|nr:22338_t:CDS:2 [Cetraspora pellucida]
MQLYSTLNNHTLREVRRGAEMMSSFLPSQKEFELFEELIVILSSFDEATQFLSGSKYLTLGFITPMLEELVRWLKYFTDQNDEVILVRNIILDNLIEQDLHCSTIQIMHHQFDELNSTQPTNDDTTLTNNDDTILHQYKKLKMSFFSHL